MSGLDWFPTLVAAAGDGAVTGALLRGKDVDKKRYKVHLDGYDQLGLITGREASRRNEIFYFAESQLGAVRIGDWKYRFIDQPSGWFGGTVMLDWPLVTNLRLDLFERASFKDAPPAMLDFYAHEFWRFVYVQQEVGKLGQTFVDYPPMQKGASFDVQAVKEKVAKAIQKKQAD